MSRSREFLGVGFWDVFWGANRGLAHCGAASPPES